MTECEPTSTGRPELWAGIECTVNRVGERYFDQVILTGHDHRPDDIERLALLGIRAQRYPILWERTSSPAAWAWSEERLVLLRKHRVRAIVGLVHHGSGPPHTSLLDSSFPEGVANHAGAVAERFPWIDAYTPINEPLTTARFSGLYGFWYPHHSDARSFAIALLNQCKAVVLSMAAIRRINPFAELVQTEDLGQTHSPEHLAYQAEFENDRRWLSWDLLCGRVDRHHPLWHFLTRHLAIPESDVIWFRENPCPPDVLGVNHYVTSERYLDARLERYPAAMHGGNGRHAYADVEAVRILPAGCLGPQSILNQTWERYHIPIAVTEVHLGCTRDEQLRWLRDVWTAACAARREGADVRAITAWSAFGAFDWDSLVTHDQGHYEPGLFDVRSDPPRPTALAHAVRELATTGETTHPILAGAGWWQRDSRLYEPPARRATQPHGAPILITDPAGRFGQALAAACERRGLAYTGFPIDEPDPRAAIAILQPWAVIHTGGYSRIDSAETEPDECRRANAETPALLAEACAHAGSKLVTFSSDFVFNGRLGRAYREGDPVSPLNVYGTTKAEAETVVLMIQPTALVVRSGLVFGKSAARDFVGSALRAVQSQELFTAANDLTVSTSYLPDLVHAVLDLIIDDERGIVHLANPEPMTLADLVREAVRTAGFDVGRIEGRAAAEFGWLAARPAYAPLASERGFGLPPVAHALERYLREIDWRAAM